MTDQQFLDEVDFTISIQEEMKQSFMDYAMSVIISRALPDVRDGCKPVHRRILFAMHEMRLTADKPFKKSARIVGEVLGKYHPHGDSAVYETMVRLAQDFSMRYMLVDGQGNFGSVDGDSAAAMRYTEARLRKLAQELLNDIEYNTVDFRPNFDGSLDEPIVLPAGVPNLLLNGVTGIAVGMATEVPPHNLKEVIDGLIHLIDNPEATIVDLMQFIKGPDFPTGGHILGESGIYNAYHTGRGSIPLRGVVDIEEGERRDRLVIKEIPYQLNKTRLIEQIAELVQTQKLEGIADLRDESDRNGMRITIELKRDAHPQVVMNNLFKYTRLQQNYNANMVALVNNKPRLLNLKEILVEYLKHRVVVITRRTQFFLAGAQKRLHLVVGFLIVLDNIDDVIALIRGSNSTQEAHEQLMARFELSDEQATAILEMQLRRLTGLEKQKLDTEQKELNERIDEYKSILSDRNKINQIIKEELLANAEKYNDARRSQLLPDPGELRHKDLIPEEPMIIIMTEQGYVKRIHQDTFEEQKRGGRGVSGIQTRDQDYITHFVTATSHSALLFFTNQGIVYRINAYEIPETSRQSKGTSIANLLEFRENEVVTALIPVESFEVEDQYLLMLTQKGIIKKTALSEFKNIRQTGKIALGLKEEDQLGWVKLTDGNQNVLISTSNGIAIHFNEGTQIRAVGRTAMGVRAIKLNPDDKVIGCAITQPEQSILTITSNGYGKRTLSSDYRLQSRAGKGIISIKLRQDGKVASVLTVDGTEEIIVVTKKGVIIRQKVATIPTYSRSTKGVVIQRLDKDDIIVEVALVVAVENDEEIEDSENALPENSEEAIQVEPSDIQDEIATEE